MYDDKVFLVIGGAGLALALALYFEAQQTPSDEIKEIELSRIKSKSKRDAVTSKKETDNIAVFRAAQKEKEKKEIAKYNKEQELYSGDGDVASKRLYFARQAYKQARASVPVVRHKERVVDEDDEEEFVTIMNELEEEEPNKNVVKEEDIKVPVTPPATVVPPREVPAPRKVVISKEIWDQRDPPRFQADSAIY